MTSFGQNDDSKDNKTTSKWEVDATPYIWLAGVKSDIAFRDTDLGQVQADFSDILRNLKMGLFMHAEARNNKLFFLGDIMYIKLAKDGNLDINATPTRLDLKQLVTELGGGYTVVNNDNAFIVDVFAGWRHLDIDTQVAIGSRIGLDRNISADHPFLGARFIINYEDWSIGVRADAGGIGVKDESSFKMNFQGIHHFSDLFSLHFGAQGLDFDFKNNDISKSILTTGFVVGGSFSF
jgi:hypothetical protein